MFKILLVAINARYVHTNLAVRYLTAKLGSGFHVVVREFTINHPPQDLLNRIYEENPDVVGFSCYLWNIDHVLRIASSLKRILPETVIVLGGPEVTYDSLRLMKEHDYIDFVVSGEGEIPFHSLMESLKENDDYSAIPGISYRVRGIVYENRAQVSPMDPRQIPLPYFEQEVFEPNRIYYYETTRGCSFQCQFCLSGNQKGVTKISLMHVYHELQLLIDNRVKQVKFVDRTFNADPDRAIAIWQFLKKTDNGITNFHFEINASLLNQEMLEFLEGVPDGLFQFEIGIQTTNIKTLKAIQRYSDQQKDFARIRQMMSWGNIHLHVDLIAGLPYEDFFSFRHSFNQVFNLGTDLVQLGFLKLLKGSGLLEQWQLFQYVYQQEPPYEVLESNAMNYGELQRLKRLEDVLERYWNSGKFRNAIQLTLRITEQDAFSFFDGLALLRRQMNPEFRTLSPGEDIACLQSYLYQCMPAYREVVDTAMQFDFCLSDQYREIPDLLRTEKIAGTREALHDVLHNPRFTGKYMRDMAHLPAKKKLPYIRLLSVDASFAIDQKMNLTLHKIIKHDDSKKWLAIIYPRTVGREKRQVLVIDLEEEFDENSVSATGKK